MRILCVYATRQVDSNLFMSSIIFNGISQVGCDVDMAFLGYSSVCDVFRKRYSRYFKNVYYHIINESKAKSILDKRERTRLLYSFYRSFLADCLKRPYDIDSFKDDINQDYDVVLSFIPPALSGYLAIDIRQSLCKSARLIQFWTDPLSLGRCNSISEIPKTRFLHKYIEKQLLKRADKVVFCYPLLCEMEQKLYPNFANKMTWSDVGYTDHLTNSINRRHKEDRRIRVGLFGSYYKRVRNIDPLLEAIPLFPDISFIIRGDSDVIIDPQNYPNLDIIKGRRPIEEIEELEQECDILLCLGGLSGITHPAGKVFYYANYPKPIVYIGDGVHNDYFKEYLREFGRYIICDNTRDSICTGIKKAIDILPSFSLEIPKRLEPRVIANSILQ